MLNPQRTIDELKELRSLTGDENGAQRAVISCRSVSASTDSTASGNTVINDSSNDCIVQKHDW